MKRVDVEGLITGWGEGGVSGRNVTLRAKKDDE